MLRRKDVRLPIQLQRAMAAEAEAAREARAKVIAAEGEQKASRALREASEVIGDSPAALQLRYLQVLYYFSFNLCCIAELGMSALEILGIPFFHSYLDSVWCMLQEYNRKFYV